MDKIKIITDSTSDLPIEIINKYDIHVIPLLVTFPEKTYKDRVDITLAEVFDKIDNEGTFPSTSQVNPQRFVDCYKSYLDQGYKIVSIHLSSKMSGTYQSACIAKGILESEDIEIIDSQNVTSGLGLLVIKACNLREQGLNYIEISNEIKEAIPHVKSVLAFETLDYLVKGGRLSKTGGFIGNVLGIKPILAVENGEMVIKDKVRGSKKAIRAVNEYLKRVGIKPSEQSILLHVQNKDILSVLRENLSDDDIPFIECEVGCVVGIYAGPGACGVFFIENY
ncbi:DegV family protein [Clostridium oceanicum]|uniref:DegV family protein n=1 Tax=Clostridium oceanicum TaxID=1543 RepID=A0ABP3UZD0_9CLOT